MNMKAAWYEQQGLASEVLKVGAMPIPKISAGDVLVKLYASGINHSDVKRRQGTREIMPFPRIIPHSDGAGVIEEVGSGVSRDRIGQRVWIYNARWGRPFGTAATYVMIPEKLAVPLSDNASFEEGACLGIPALTAYASVFAEGSIQGKTLLVTGGAGSVGYYAIQFAKWGGATVITTVSNEKKAAFAKNAGADYILNYRTEDIVENIKNLTENQGVDRIVEVDFGGNLNISQDIIKLNGCIAAYASEGNPTPVLPFYKLMFKGVTLHLIIVYELPDKLRSQAIDDINQLLAAQALKHPIAATFSLDDIVTAHELVESNTAIGNVVLSF